METSLSVDIHRQPDNATCGPTCLEAVYQYYGDRSAALEQVIAEVPQLPEGGTLGVLLACHALKRGYHATIYTYNLQMFDPTWFVPGGPDLSERLRRQAEFKDSPTMRLATNGYLEFLALGGRLRFEDLTAGLIRKYLNRGVPIITGLSATYLHRSIREFGPNGDDDDLRGEPVGHFVVLCGYEKQQREVLVADPLEPPVGGKHRYLISIDRVLGAILLGILTHDANLVIIEPKRRAGRLVPGRDGTARPLPLVS